ncbi:hypothetical protein [Caudoviricetes sp.]|nr:hypothetical protein [Caudoviricetes sp.]
MKIFPDANLSRIKQAHRTVLAKTTTAIAEATAEAGEAGVAYAKRYPRFTPRTGDTQRANEWRTVKVAGGRILRIRNTKKHAAALDKGARPHDIVARRKPFLHFLGKRGWVRTKRVKHPGNRPYRFLHGATIAAGRLLGVKLAAKMARISKQF